MAGALFHITDAGRAALVAPGNTGTNAHKIVAIGVSTAAFDASDRTLKSLPSELKRLTTFSGDNVAPDTIHVTLRDDTPDQYKLFGFGLYLENGVLFGAYSQSAADGPIMEKSPAAMVLLSSDVQFATIDAAQLVFGDASFTNPPATTERQGVVELATQAEVNAGTDDVRAVTPKTAATRYAALTGAAFSGPVSAAAAAGDTEAQLYAKGASGAGGREGKLRFYGTFGNNDDTNTRLAASIRAGFNGGNWGTEYLDFCLNYGAANDAERDALQARVLRLVAGGRALFNTAVDDGTSIAQFGGNVSTRGVHRFGYGATTGWASADASVAYFRSNGNVSVGSEAAAGFLDLVAGGGATRVRILPSGRVLFGTSTDDGTSIAQFAGNTRTYGSHSAGAAGTVTAWVAADTQYGYFRTAGNASIGSEAAAGSTELIAGNKSFIKVLPSGRVLIGDTANDDGTNRVQVDGPARINGNMYVNTRGSEGQVWLGPNEGYFFANSKQAGYYSPKYGQYQYDFALKNLTVQNNEVWHAGNLNPLDLGKGGTIYGDVTFATGRRLLLDEGSAANPSLSFVNDGAPDTGFFHVADGVFAISNNARETMRFGTDVVSTQRTLISNVTNVTGTNGVFRSSGDIGGSFVDWSMTGNRIAAVQVDAPQSIMAYMGMRWTRWGGRHFAAIDAYEGGSGTSEPSIVFHLDGRNNAWSFGRNEIARSDGLRVWGGWNFDPATKLNTAGGTLTGRLTMTKAGSFGEIGLASADGTAMFMRGRASGGGMEWVNSAYNSIPAVMDDGGNMTFAGIVRVANGGAWVATDGNVYGAAWGGYLSNYLANKANAGAQVRWNSGVVEFGAVNVHSEGTADLGDPWVMVGLRRVGDGGIYIRGTWLRNQ
ncbi:hypothetical protein [Paraburkholderia bryophila]|nr:hypothetical protein [Paraburkholderia bryophila]